MKMITVVILFLACVWLYKNATEQFSPEVQRVTIDNKGWGSCSWVGIESSLYHQGIASMADKGGGQYFDFQANVQTREVSSIYVDAPDSLKSKYKYYTGVAITSSGSNFKCLDYCDDFWHENDNRYVAFDAVRITNVDNHKYTLDNLTSSEYALVDIAIKGDNIFCESESRNPYIAFHVDFDNVNLDSEGNGYLSFYYVRDTVDVSSKPYSSPLNILSVYPEPDYVTPTKIYFEKSIRDVLNTGVYIIAEDLSKKRDQDVRSFMCSVLLGVLIPFIVQLVLELIKYFKRKLEPSK